MDLKAGREGNYTPSTRGLALIYKRVVLLSVLSDAVLSCEFRTEKDQNPRIEWKKKGKAVTFVYFNNKFTGK